MLAGFVLSGALASLGFLLVGDDGPKLLTSALSAAGLWAGLVGTVLLASRLKGAGTLAADFGFGFRKSDLAVGTGAGLAAQLVVLPLLALILSPLLGRPEVSGPARDLIGQANGSARILLVLLVVAGAPVVEELFYRGLLLRSLQRRFRALAAIAGSAAVFALSHQSGLPLRGLILVWSSLALFGAILAVLAVRTGRLGAPIVAHAVFNAFTIAYVLAS